jgi:hypothetical protein
MSIVLDVCLVLLHTLFYCVILHADIDSPALAWLTVESFWTQDVLDHPENTVCLGWWVMYIFMSCHISGCIGFVHVMESLC